MIAAQHDRHGAGCKDLTHHLFGAFQMTGGVAEVGAHIAAIDHIDRLAVVQRAAEIEVIALDRTDQTDR